MTRVGKTGQKYRGIVANPNGSREERRAAKRLRVEPPTIELDLPATKGRKTA
jgi:hypothetical protein